MDLLQIHVDTTISGWLLVFRLYKDDYLQMLKCVSFLLHSFCS